MSNQTTKKNIHDGHRERVRENVLKNGFEQLEDHKLLELLLFYSIPRGDTNELAHRLLNEFGSLTEIVKASPKKLTKVLGIGESSAIQLSAMGELCTRVVKESAIKRTAYRENEDIVALIRAQYINEKNERLLLICFESGMRLKHIEFVAEGDSIRTSLDYKSVVAKILENDASIVIMAHNHPDGSALPSGADIDSTTSLSVLLRKMDIILADHIIINRNSYFSMRADPRYSSIFC